MEWGYIFLSICAFCYMLNIFGVVVFHRSMVNWGRDTCALSIWAFCYMSNFFGVTVFHTSMVNWSEGTSALSICAFCYMWNISSVLVVFHTYMVNWGRGPWYMCILLYVKLSLVYCSVSYIYGQLKERVVHVPQDIYAFWQYVKHIWCSGVPNISGQLG